MGVVLEVGHLLTLGFQLLGSVEGDISLAGIQQLLDIFLIDFPALTLTIRAIVAAEADTLVKLDAEPLERLDDIILCAGHKAGGVGILDTEHEVAAVLTGKQIVVQRGANTANVKCARRAWCKAHPNSSFCHLS